MPDSLRFLMILVVLGAAVYGGAWWLAHFPPEPVEVEKSIANDRLRG